MMALKEVSAQTRAWDLAWNVASAGVIEGSTGKRASWIKATLSPVTEKRQAHMGAEVGEGHQNLLPTNRSWPGLGQTLPHGPRRSRLPPAP